MLTLQWTLRRTVLPVQVHVDRMEEILLHRVNFTCWIGIRNQSHRNQALEFCKVQVLWFPRAILPCLLIGSQCGRKLIISSVVQNTAPRLTMIVLGGALRPKLYNTVTALLRGLLISLAPSITNCHCLKDQGYCFCCFLCCPLKESPANSLRRCESCQSRPPLCQVQGS